MPRQVNDMIEDFSHLPVSGPEPVFILQAPRSGCTLLYLMIVALYQLPYFSNFTNEKFADTPEYGVLSTLGLPRLPKINFESNLGKTSGTWTPSEASAVMTHFFGGGYPSEVVSANFLEGKREAFQNSIRNVQRLSEKPLVIKNAWNSFRIRALREAFPQASFIWSRRDIVDAAKSDYVARIIKYGDPNIWSSASPANYLELLERPVDEHSLENQLEVARAISDGLKDVPEGQKMEIWYEDFVRFPFQTLSSLRQNLRNFSHLPEPDPNVIDFSEIRKNARIENKKNLGIWQASYDEISQFAEQNDDRYGGLRSFSRPTFVP